MRRTICMAGVLLLASGAALSQTTMDRSFKAVSKDCAGVQWTQEALQQYPNLSRACQSVEVRDGKTYVKFQGTVARNVDRGKQIDVRVKDGDTVTLSPPEGTSVYINDRKTPVSQLSRGDELNFYIPEDRFTAQLAQDTSAQPQLVTVPIVYRETTTYQTPERTASLPATATDRGLMLIFAAIALLFGATLTLGRVRKHNR